MPRRRAKSGGGQRRAESVSRWRTGGEGQWTSLNGRVGETPPWSLGDDGSRSRRSLFVLPSALLLPPFSESSLFVSIALDVRERYETVFPFPAMSFIYRPSSLTLGHFQCFPFDLVMISRVSVCLLALALSVQANSLWVHAERSLVYKDMLYRYGSSSFVG